MKISEEEKQTTRDKAEKRIASYLDRQGFNITFKAVIKGKSGIEHNFDMIAEKSLGISTQVIAINILISKDKQVDANLIFDFANDAYDVGIKDRIIVAVPSIDDEIRSFAVKQRIKVIDEEQIEALILQEPEQKKVSPSKSFKFSTKAQLIESLTNLGYKVEEKAVIKGKSGIDYSFDIVAYGSGGRIGHSIGIDIFNKEQEVDLNDVTMFDTKAYDVGIDDKVIALLRTTLNDQAKQFATHQDIKILELESIHDKSVQTQAEETAPPAEQIKNTEEILKINLPSEKASKLLRQMPQPEAIMLIPEVLARRYNAIPLKISGKTLEVAMSDPKDILALEAFSIQSRMRIKPITASVKEIRDAIDFNYKAYGEIERQISTISFGSSKSDEKLNLDSITDAPLVQALNLIIDEAVKARSSDIHIEPEEKRVRIRYRIDGTLQDMMSLPLEIHSALISRIKILSNLNIADHFRAQDGQFSTDTNGRKIDIRVATSPTVNGEMSVLRLLDKSTAMIGLTELGMLPDSQEKFEQMLKIPYGMILVSGPTGAGKTTTLYAAVNSLDKMGRNIVTIEDPAEYRFDDINQIQVNSQAGITFASGLRSILRLDPDVILVGEIRDAETANIAVQAALTGHLMLSSIHANDTIGVIFRLMDLGVEPFLIASSVIGVMAQRMVRKICPDCQQMIEAPVVEQIAYEKEIGKKREKFMYASGCKTCAYTGYLRRTGIFEILFISDKIRRMIVNNANSSDLRQEAVSGGMISMMNDGMRKVELGITTPAEVLRSAYSTEQ